jgi:ABC-2 type transport system permease protein
MNRSTLPYLGALLATNLKASLADRGAFWLQAVLMALNDVLFFCVWWLFFRNVPSVRGWTLVDVYALYGFVALAFGVFCVLAAGTRDFSDRVIKGELDALLTQPRAVLPRIAFSRSGASGWGDVIFGIVLLGLGAHLDPGRLPVLVVLAFVSAFTLAMSAVLANSLVFWVGEMDNLPRQMMEFTIVFSTYPSALFGGALKVVLFTLLPAGLIGYLPVAWIREPSWGALLWALGASLAYALVVLLVFSRGLERYESGSRFTAGM